MTPAETLRKAAALMRDRAQAATPGPWRREQDTDHTGYGPNFVANWDGPYLQGVASPGDGDEAAADAAHIASWHPAVALAVADWLSMTADHATGRGAVCGSCVEQALAVARAFLGTEATDA